ncbi:Uncharacterized protein TCM_017900 [Theobroma cacao]|uniref:Uncharacterized protein n=1 Tax=Theobroma cacao TaxID=3641 RepID=A0A061EE29_THECC|nr:Uncharacterized protein TCM_017900 [Theobroma cacao]
MLSKFYCMVGLACCSRPILWISLLEGHEIWLYMYLGQRAGFIEATIRFASSKLFLSKR